MKDVTTDGLILAVKENGENDRFVTMLTPELGRIRVLVKGGRSIRGPQGAVTQLFTYGKYELTMRGDLYCYRNGMADRVFFPFRAPIERSALMYYLADVAIETTDENESSEETLRMLLNAFYLLFSEENWNSFREKQNGRKSVPRDIELVKAAFEFRTAVEQGYAPDLDGGCAICGKTTGADFWYLDVDNGRILCPDCVGKLGKEVKVLSEDDRRVNNSFCPLSPAALAALRYIAEAPQQRLYLFSLAEESDLADLASAAETYLLHHLGHGFGTLDFYKTVR